MNKPKKAGVAGVVVDDWKLPVFEKHLKKAGFAYTVLGGVTAKTRTLIVEFDDLEKLRPVVQEANDECARGPLQ